MGMGMEMEMEMSGLCDVERWCFRFSVGKSYGSFFCIDLWRRIMYLFSIFKYYVVTIHQDLYLASSLHG